MREALLYQKLPRDRVECNLCNHRCLIFPDGFGVCRVRKNLGGILYSLVYEKLIARHIDPIEKKPLFHFFPGSRAYSLATAGCNFKCLNCQNADISQAPREHFFIEGEEISVKEIVEEAEEQRCQSIAYTYTEPTVFFEYAYDCAQEAKDKGIYNIFVTNGYMTREAWELMAPFLDACNVDLKSFSEKFYADVCGAKLEPVLESLKYIRELGMWLEVTTLLIPGLNDSEKEMREIASFIYNELGAEVPWHISRFYPAYKLNNLGPESIEKLKKGREIGMKVGLKYVYLGNVLGDEGENTYCYNCKKLIIERRGYEIVKYNIKEGKCKFCNVVIDGRGM